MTNNHIQKYIAEFREKFRHCSCELWNGDIKPSDVENWLTKTLKSVDEEARKEERKRIVNLVSNIDLSKVNSKELLHSLNKET